MHFILQSFLFSGYKKGRCGIIFFYNQLSNFFVRSMLYCLLLPGINVVPHLMFYENDKHYIRKELSVFFIKLLLAYHFYLKYILYRIWRFTNMIKISAYLLYGLKWTEGWTDTRFLINLIKWYGCWVTKNALFVFCKVQL